MAYRTDEYLGSRLTALERPELTALGKLPAVNQCHRPALTDVGKLFWHAVCSVAHMEALAKLIWEHPEAFERTQVPCGLLGLWEVALIAEPSSAESESRRGARSRHVSPSRSSNRFSKRSYG